MAPAKPMPASGTYVTPAQAAIFQSYMRTHSESETARELSVSQIRVREGLIQYERNLLRDAGLRPPPLKEMLKGDVSTRFQISRDLRNGRPSAHPRAIAIAVPALPATAADSADSWRHVTSPQSGVRRLLVTAARADSAPHVGFMRNLQAYAAHHGAELVVAALGPRISSEPGLTRTPIDVAGRLDVRADVTPPTVARLPLEGLQHLSPGRWAVFPHATQQLESLPRIGSQPPRVQLTTGAATVHPDPTRRTPARLGGLVIEMLPDGRVFARTISADAAGDGTFHDLDERVAGGRVATRQRVSGLVLGDIHHPLTDPAVILATWGRKDRDGGLCGRLRPHVQVLHDICDMRARTHHQRRDPHARFAHHVQGTGDVRAELAATAAFLGRIRLEDGLTAVVHSNHDDHLLRWLREADHRADPANAEFQLDRERALLARIRSGTGTATFFAETMRSLSPDGLKGLRFIADGESLEIAGVQCGVHGHAGPDGTRGSIGAFERLGIDMVLGHFHHPAARGGVHVAGVCQLDLGYNRGPTSWAISHVIVHDDGARQHVFLDGDRFTA